MRHTQDPQAHHVPRDVDAPVPVMFWDPVEFVIAISVLGFGMLMNLWVLGGIGAVGVLMGSQKLKRGAKRGAVQHFLWRTGLLIDPSLKKKFPAPWENEYIE